MGILAICITSISQEIQHEAVAVNIEVPVRVFKGDIFIDDLALDDFEIYENGVLQKAEAVYLIKKTDIKRKEIIEPAKKGKKIYKPETSRYFVLCFILTEYLPKVDEAVDDFFSRIFQKGDSLSIITPLKTYNMKSETFERIPKEKIKQQLTGILRKDIQIGCSEYRETLKELIKAARSNAWITYRELLERLKRLRYIDQKRLLKFADFLKQKEGQKYVFMFYQMEPIPLPFPEMVDNVDPTRPGSMNAASAFFDLVSEGISIDANLVKQAYNDSLTCVHFLYITKSTINSPIDTMRLGSLEGMKFIDRGTEIFSIFNEMAQATGGISESTANISYAFKKASYASEHYYLLYYTPKNYKADGKFRNIKVKIRGNNYKVFHRGGYIVD